MGTSHFRLPNSSGTRPVISTNLTTEENVSELSIEGGEKARDRLRARSFLRLEENSSSCAVAKQRMSAAAGFFPSWDSGSCLCPPDVIDVGNALV